MGRRLAARAGTGLPRTANADDFVADEVLGGLAGDFESIAGAFGGGGRGRSDPRNRLYQLPQRLQRTFAGEVTSFERKTYVSLSHEANKAMNLNAYIGLMGRSFAVDVSPKGVHP